MLSMVSPQKNPENVENVWHHQTFSGNSNAPSRANHRSNGKEEDILAIREALEWFQDKVKDKEDKEEIIEEWKLVSRVVDRCCFYFISLVTVSLTVGLFVHGFIRTEHPVLEY